MKMRLTDVEQNAILVSVLKFDGDAEVYLFGSRVDNARKGGDVDILVRSDILNKSMLHLLEDELFKYIDEQSVDFVLTGISRLSSFASMVLEQGAVRLCPKKN